MRGSASCCMWRCWCSGRLRARPPARSPHASLTVRSGRSRSPPVPSGPSGALYAGGACVAGVSLGVSSRSRAWSRRCSRAPQLGQRGYCASSTFACNSSVTISVFELASLELQRFWVLLKLHAIELHAESLVCVSVVTHGHRSRSLLEARPVSPDPPALQPGLSPAHVRRSLVNAAIVRLALSHAIPLSLFQYLNWHRWNCNVSGLC